MRPLLDGCMHRVRPRVKERKEKNWIQYAFRIVVKNNDGTITVIGRTQWLTFREIRNHMKLYNSCGTQTIPRFRTNVTFIPGAGKNKNATAIDEEADIMIGEHEYYSYTKKFKYLGTIFTSSLKDDDDIKRRISQACGAFAQAEKVLCNRKLQAITRTRFYEATVVNLLLWGCGSWALTKEQKQKLEVCHHRSLRKMAGITIFDVKEKRITNKQVRERLGNCRSLHQLPTPPKITRIGRRRRKDTVPLSSLCPSRSFSDCPFMRVAIVMR